VGLSRKEVVLVIIRHSPLCHVPFLLCFCSSFRALFFFESRCYFLLNTFLSPALCYARLRIASSRVTSSFLTTRSFHSIYPLSPSLDNLPHPRLLLLPYDYSRSSFSSPFHLCCRASIFLPYSSPSPSLLGLADLFREYLPSISVKPYESSPSYL